MPTLPEPVIRIFSDEASLKIMSPVSPEPPQFESTYKAPPDPPVMRTFVLSSESSSNTAGIVLRICKALSGLVIPMPTLPPSAIVMAWDIVVSVVLLLVKNARRPRVLDVPSSSDALIAA